MRAPLALVLAAAVAVSGAGCGSGDEPGPSTGAVNRIAGGGGVLRYATGSLPENLDPLAAHTRTEQLVSRQVHEPLVGVITAPYGAEVTGGGLAAMVTPSESHAEWTIVLRTGVRFQDGTPLDVAAMLANARRWIASPAGARLLPGAFAADSPRPGTVRLLFRGPVEGVRGMLASPRLGVVSPAALEAGGGERSRLRPDATGTGTGPFKVGARGGGSLELARNAEWWGSRLGLGPALDSVSFTSAATPAGRTRLLVDGAADVAEVPGAAGVGEISTDPLLRSRGGQRGIAYVASVRGLDPPPAIPALSGVWLTRIGG